VRRGALDHLDVRIVGAAYGCDRYLDPASIFVRANLFQLLAAGYQAHQRCRVKYVGPNFIYGCLKLIAPHDLYH
jgi:hypothetical protein